MTAEVGKSPGLGAMTAESGDRPVAIKVLAPRLAADPTFGWQLRGEAQAAGKLCHPHITKRVRLRGAGRDAVRRHGAGRRRSMAVLGNDGPMPWPEAVRACAELASALAVAHANGVVPRDVKPSTVMLTASGAKVVDFGISALIGANDVTPEGNLLGTPAYLAPNGWRAGRSRPATYVYALGLLLCRARPATCRGRRPPPHRCCAPTAAPTPARSYRSKELPEAIALLCRRCLDKRPDNRAQQRRSGGRTRVVLDAYAGADWSPSPAANASSTPTQPVSPRPAATWPSSRPARSRSRRATRSRCG